MFDTVWKMIYVIAGIIVVIYLYRVINNNYGKKKTIHTTILSKRIEKPFHYNDSMKEKAYIHYYITPSNHKEVECDEIQYNHLTEGQEVDLVIRGKMLVEII